MVELAGDHADLDTLELVALIHDIGWHQVLPDSKTRISKAQLKRYEPKANENIKRMVTMLFAEIGNNHFEYGKVIRLINAADKHRSNSEDEAIIVDADNLSKLDIDQLKDKYQQDDWMNMYELWDETFSERIQASKGKDIYPKLLKVLKVGIEKA